MADSNSELLSVLHKQILPYRKALIDASRIMSDKEVTEYPIFIFHKDSDIEVGIELINRENVAGDWSVRASSMEEFSSKSLILPEKLENFKSVYKDPEDWLCLFVLSELGPQFVFIPKVGPIDPSQN